MRPIFHLILMFLITGFTPVNAIETTTLISESLAVSNENSSERNWAELAQADLAFAHQTIVGQHPGFVDPNNPVFSNQASEAYEKALQMASHAKNEFQYREALNAYASSYRDIHVIVHFDEPASDPYVWAGFTSGVINDQLTVLHAEDWSGVSIGSKIQACDSTPVHKLLMDRVFATRGDPNMTGSQMYDSAYLFLHTEEQAFEQLKECHINDENVSLSWRPIEEGAFKDLAYKIPLGVSPFTGEGRPPMGIEEISEDVFWINISNFAPKSPSEAEAIHALINQLSENIEKIRDADQIILDVTGNFGGNSRWGTLIANTLWGEDYVYQQYQSNAYVEWRATQENLEHMQRMVERNLSQGLKESSVTWIREIIVDMQNAIDQGQDLFIRSRDLAAMNEEEIESSETYPNPVSGQVLFLTHVGCGSSCLNFSDKVLGMENVIQIGRPTAADSEFLEARSVRLPSDMGRVGFPIKVYREAIRESGQQYMPEHTYPELFWEQDQLKDWVLKLIEAEAL